MALEEENMLSIKLNLSRYLDFLYETCFFHRVTYTMYVTQDY